MTKVVWDDDTTYGLYVSRIITWPTGVWPLEDRAVLANIRSIFTVTGVAFLVFVLIIEVLLGNASPGERIDCIMIITSAINGCVKVSSCKARGKNLFHIYSAAVNDYASIDSSRKRNVMRRHAYIARIMGCSMVLIAYAACISFLYTLFVTNNSDLARNMSGNVSRFTKYPLPSTYISTTLTISPVGYVFICITQFILLSFACIANIGSDSFILSTVLHICGQIEVLKLDLADCNLEKAKGQEMLRTLASRHSELLILARYLVETMSIALVLQLLISCTTFCALGLQCILSLNVGDYFMFGKTTVILGTLLMQLFSYGYVGDYLKTQTEDIAVYVYGVFWYSVPPDVIRNIVLITLRAQQSVQLMAAHFIPLNMETYMSILKTSFSYLSVLRVMLET